MIRCFLALVLAVMWSCNDGTPSEPIQTPVDFDTSELASLVRQVCAADSGEYTREACIIEYQRDVLKFSIQAEDPDDCYDAFIQGLRCEAERGSAADAECYGTIDFASRCAGSQSVSYAQIPEDARMLWSASCTHLRDCYDLPTEPCLLERYVNAEVYRLERGIACASLQAAFLECDAMQECGDTEACRDIREKETKACDYPQVRK